MNNSKRKDIHRYVVFEYQFISNLCKEQYNFPMHLCKPNERAHTIYNINCFNALQVRRFMKIKIPKFI